MKIGDVRFIQFLLLVAGLSVVSWYARTVSDMAQGRGAAKIGPAAAEAGSIDRVQAGDPIKIVTPTGEYVYQVEGAEAPQPTLMRGTADDEPVLLTIESNPARGANAKRLVLRAVPRAGETATQAQASHIGG